MTANQKSSKPQGVLQGEGSEFTQVWTESEIETFFSISLDLICVANLDGYFTKLNPAWSHVLGYSLEELLGKPYMEFVHPEDRESTREVLGEIAKGQDLRGFTNRYRTKDGEYRWLEWTCPAVQPGDSFMYAIARDATDKKLNNEILQKLNAELQNLIRQLQESERKYKALYEESPAMHAHVDPLNATIKDCNQLLVDRLGYDAKDQILGQSIHFIYHEGCRKNVERAFRQFVDSGSVENAELSLKRSDGSELPVILNVSSVRDENGAILYSSSTWSDISDLKRHANELERVNRDLQEFTYVASHDLKAPLRAISHLSSWIEEDMKGKLSEEAAKHLKQLKSRTARMDKLLSDLLEYSRAGRSQGEETIIDLNEVMENVSELNKKEGFSVKTQFEVTQLRGYRISLETVIRNLVSNSLKHHDQENGNILVETIDQRDMTFFRVSDDGPGISPELYQKAFTMFQTLQPRDEVEGSGMGLAIVKRIIESNGGRIWIEQNQPRGTKICFTWPK